MYGQSTEHYLELLQARPLSVAERRWVCQHIASASSKSAVPASIYAINERLLQRCNDIASLALLARARKSREGRAALNGGETAKPKDNDVCMAAWALGHVVRDVRDRQGASAAVPIAMTFIRELKCPIPV